MFLRHFSGTIGVDENLHLRGAERVGVESVLSFVEGGGDCVSGCATGVEAVDHGLDDGEVFVEAILAFVLGLDVDGHLQPAV